MTSPAQNTQRADLFMQLLGIGGVAWVLFVAWAIIEIVTALASGTGTGSKLE